jgi:hypothetical protein
VKRRDPLRLWVFASSFLLVLSLVAYTRRGLPPLALPTTPFDRANPDLADQWRFLDNTRRHVPPGASYTVIAPDRGTAMSLFMFSRALLPDRVARPTTYWDAATPEVGTTAEYVLAYHIAVEAEPGLRIVDRHGSGMVAVRERRSP